MGASVAPPDAGTQRLGKPRLLPVDFGLGARWNVLPVLGVLAGVHHIADRSSGGTLALPAGVSPIRGVSPDQGTFLDAGVVVGMSPVHMALAIEDNNISNAGSKATIVTLSAQAAF